MGFYGNITNTSRTQFKFERVYANRYLMDNSAATDGVYMGNYVLVDYDTELQADWCITAYAYTPDPSNINNIHFYPLPIDQTTGNGRITYSQCRLSKNVYSTAAKDGYYTKYILVPANKTVNGNTVVYNHIGGSMTTPSINPGSEKDVLFRVTGWTGGADWASSASYPTVEAISRDNTEYGKNLEIDQQYYDTARGYDSTVWQKVYTGSPATAHYVMLAELNTVVPTFTVSADAPTVSPLAPHFDTGSTNVLYNLHVQPSWGLRVKSATDTYVMNKINPETGSSSGSLLQLNFDPAGSTLLSDETTQWSFPYYDTVNNQLESYTYWWKDTANNGMAIKGQWSVSPQKDYSSDIPAAIYYNKAGFDSKISTHAADAIKDGIKLTPTGLSGRSYNSHSFRYELVGLLMGTEQFDEKVAFLRAECARKYPDDIQRDTESGATWDLYRRDYLYTRVDGVYKVANSWANAETLYYKKTTLPLLGEQTPQVDTQELSIMLPSLGNTIASVWDIMYGDEKLNKTKYRNQSINWLDGRVFYHDDGLRIVTTDDSGYGYVPEAANTVAGALNSMHDALGMLIKKRPDNKLVREKLATDPANYQQETKADVASLSSAYIYYYPAEGRYYRRGVTYQWGERPWNDYEAVTLVEDEDHPGTMVEKPTKLTEDFLQPVDMQKFRAWPSPNEFVYYRELAYQEFEDQTLWDEDAQTYYTSPVLKTERYNYICEQDYYKGRIYGQFRKTLVAPGSTYDGEANSYWELDKDNNIFTPYVYDANTWATKVNQEVIYTQNYPFSADKVNVDDENFTKFEQYRYYNYDEQYSYTLNTTDSSGNPVQRTLTVPGFFPTPDTEYNKEKNYWDISSYVSIGDDYRLFEYVENDLTRQFYTVPDDKWEARTITLDDYNKAPTKYYVSDGDGHYIRSSGYDSTQTYYVPTSFDPALVFDPSVEYYYTVEVATTQDNEIYISQISYIPYQPGIITATNFDDNICYEETVIDGKTSYAVAKTFVDGKQYYYRLQRWVLSEMPTRITSDNATQVRCINPDARDNDVPAKPVYYYYNPIGPVGLPEYYGISMTTVGHTANGQPIKKLTQKLDFPIVTLTKNQQAGFYAANTMYYQVEDGPYKGSWLLDSNARPTEGRVYYIPMDHYDFEEFVDEEEGIPYTFYEGQTYYDDTGELNSSTVYDPDTQQYYISAPLYVYSIADDSPAKGKFQVGDKWNMDIDLDAADGLELRQLIETPTMIPLNGFARSSQTMNGSILNIDEVLSKEDIYTRSRKTINGTINSMNDIINVFEDIKANEPIISDKFGQLYSRGIVLNNNGDANVIAHNVADNADPWVHITEDRSTDQKNWHIQVHHKKLNNADNAANLQRTQTTYNVQGVNHVAAASAAYKPNFGDTFNVLNGIKVDEAGHTHTMSNTDILIPLPSLGEVTNLNPSNDYLVMMDIALNAPTGALTYRRHNVADLKLHDYSNANVPNAANGGAIISSTNTINTAFAAIETYIAATDYSNKADINKYITTLTQDDGRIAYEMTTLINTSADIVNDGSNKAKTAVSGQAVRQAINDLDYASQFATTVLANNNEYIVGLAETDGIISYEVASLLNSDAAITTTANNAVSGKGVRDVINALDSEYHVTVADGEYVTGIEIVDGKITASGQTGKSTFLTSVTNESTSKVAPSAAAVATYVNGLFTDTAYTNKASTAKWITSLSQSYGKISYEVTDLLASVEDVYGVNAGYAASGMAIRNAIDDIFLSLPVLEEGNFLTGLLYEYASTSVLHYRLKGTSAAFKTAIVGNETSVIAPTAKAVYDYLNLTYSGTSNIVTVGTINTGIWQGTAIANDYIGTGIDASKIGNATDSILTNANIGASRVGVTGDLALNSNVTLSAQQITSDVLAVTYGGTGVNTVAANLVFIGPDSGVNAAPTWRALTAADIPVLPADKIGSGVFEVAQWAMAPLNTMPHTSTSNGVTTVTYPALSTLNSNTMPENGTAFSDTDTLLDVIQKLRYRLNKLTAWVDELLTNNPTITPPTVVTTADFAEVTITEESSETEASDPGGT